jgi:hypothetical protein
MPAANIILNTVLKRHANFVKKRAQFLLFLEYKTLNSLMVLYHFQDGADKSQGNLADTFLNIGLLTDSTFDPFYLS